LQVCRWLYPFSKRGGDEEGYYWPSTDGQKEPVSLRGYERLIRSRSLLSSNWVLTTNYRRVRSGDYLYVYTGDEDAGIVGFGVIRRVGEPLFYRHAKVDVRIDFTVSADLLRKRPIDAAVVRAWLHDQKRAVENVTRFAQQLDRHLRHIKGYGKYVLSR
jgi:predicted GNAT family acetyltransferase